MEDTLVVFVGIVMVPAAIWFLLVWPFRRDRALVRSGSQPFLWGSFIIGWFFAVLWMTPILMVFSIYEEISEGLSGWSLVGKVLLIVCLYLVWAFFTLNLNDRRRWAWGVLTAFMGLFSVVTIVGVSQDSSTAGNQFIAVVIWSALVAGQTALFVVYIKKRWHELLHEVWLPWRPEPTIGNGA